MASLAATLTGVPVRHYRKKPPDLTVVQVHSTSILPRESVTYCKQTQTASSGPEQSGKDGTGVGLHIRLVNDSELNHELNQNQIIFG